MLIQINHPGQGTPHPHARRAENMSPQCLAKEIDDELLRLSSHPPLTSLLTAPSRSQKMFSLASVGGNLGPEYIYIYLFIIFFSPAHRLSGK